jgi:hypothetical protein
MLKRVGADHVAKLLAGKTKQEELYFWNARTSQLRSSRNKTDS